MKLWPARSVVLFSRWPQEVRRWWSYCWWWWWRGIWCRYSEVGSDVLGFWPGAVCLRASLNCYSNSHPSGHDDNDNDWWNHWLLVGQKIMATQKLEINCTMCKQLRPTSLQSEWYDPANCWKTSRWCDRTDFWPAASSHHLEYFPRQFGHYCHCS